jgi:hypothetical protein
MACEAETMGEIANRGISEATAEGRVDDVAVKNEVRAVNMINEGAHEIFIPSIRAGVLEMSLAYLDHKELTETLKNETMSTSGSEEEVKKNTPEYFKSIQRKALQGFLGLLVDQTWAESLIEKDLIAQRPIDTSDIASSLAVSYLALFDNEVHNLDTDPRVNTRQVAEAFANVTSSEEYLSKFEVVNEQAFMEASHKRRRTSPDVEGSGSVSVEDDAEDGKLGDHVATSSSEAVAKDEGLEQSDTEKDSTTASTHKIDDNNVGSL